MGMAPRDEAPSVARRNDVFLRFAHGILNHTDNLIADALSKLPDVKATRELMQNEAQWRALSDTEREQRETALQDNERTVTGSLQLANETVTFISLMTAEVQGPLLTDELRDRVGSILASVISRLAGPRGVELKVLAPYPVRVTPFVFDSAAHAFLWLTHRWRTPNPTISGRARCCAT